MKGNPHQMGKDPLEDHSQAGLSGVVHCTCHRQREGVVDRRKVAAQAHWREVVACKEGWDHVEGSAEQGEVHMGDWPLQLDAGTWGLKSTVHTERELALVTVSEDVMGFAGSPLALAGDGAEVGVAGGMAADWWGPLTAAVRGSRGVQMGVQIETFVGCIGVHLWAGGWGERGSGFEGGIGFGAVAGH